MSIDNLSSSDTLIKKNYLYTLSPFRLITALILVKTEGLIRTTKIMRIFSFLIVNLISTTLAFWHWLIGYFSHPHVISIALKTFPQWLIESNFFERNSNFHIIFLLRSCLILKILSYHYNMQKKNESFDLYISNDLSCLLNHQHAIIWINLLGRLVRVMHNIHR